MFAAVRVFFWADWRPVGIRDVRRTYNEYSCLNFNLELAISVDLETFFDYS